MWPSFHDAEVVSLARTAETCVAVIHVFEATNQVDTTGHFILDKHHPVELCMRGVRTDTLPRTYTGDVLNGLGAEQFGPLIRVLFD